VVNDARQNKPAIKVKPVDDHGDVETAEVLSGLIRNIEYISNADVAYDTAVDNAVTCGFGYLRVGIDFAHDDSFDMDIKIDRVANIFSVYGDPLSTQADSSDWMKAFVVDTMSKEAFRKKYKGAEEVSWDDLGYSNLAAPWMEQETLQIAEWWQREEITRKIVLLNDGNVIDAKQYQQSKEIFDALGLMVQQERDVKSWKVTQRIMTGAEIIETNDDWPGIYIPIIPVYGDEVNVEGKRYFRSLIREAKDSQRIYNYWRTTGTELVALSPRVPFLGPTGAFATDARKWATINTQNHPYIEYDGPIPPQRQPLDTGPALGAMQEALTASDDIKATLGIFDASLGAKGNETSGKAILARQRESDTSTFHFIDNLSRAIRHLGRVVIDLVPHVYNGPRILRIIGEDGTTENVPVNQPLPNVPNTEEGARQETGETQQAIANIYDLTTGRYDVVVEAGPSYNTKREEAAVQMTELIRAYPQGAPLMADLLAKNLDWPGAEDIAERFKAMLPPQIQGVDPQTQQLQQQFMQLQQQAQQAVGQLQQQIQQLQQDKTIDLKKTEIDAYNAETKRIQATQQGMTPEQVQVIVLQTLQQALSSPDPSPPDQTQQPIQQPAQAGFFTPTDNQPNGVI
jgi:hypothetical protein